MFLRKRFEELFFYLIGVVFLTTFSQVKFEKVCLERNIVMWKGLNPQEFCLLVVQLMAPVAEVRMKVEGLGN